MEVAEHAGELPARIACITFAQPERLPGFERKMRLPYPVYGDPSRASYEALGLGRAPWWRVWLDPRVWWRYATLIARGRRAERSDMDELQLGGDAVLDAEGRLAWLYRSDGPEDRPSMEELSAAVRRAA